MVRAIFLRVDDAVYAHLMRLCVARNITKKDVLIDLIMREEI